MNEKMRMIGNEIGNYIFRYFGDYVYAFMEFDINIEDLISQILIRCCRFAYLKNEETHPVKYYILEDGLEYELERKKDQRIYEYISEKFEIEEEIVKGILDIDINKPDTQPSKNYNRFPSYSITKFQYWELKNIHDMKLVKSILERRIISPKMKYSDFQAISNQYDQIVEGIIQAAKISKEDMVLSSIKLLTLQAKYGFDYYYQVADIMESKKLKEFPNFHDRLMAVMGRYVCMSSLPQEYPNLVHINDTFIEYPFVLQRMKFCNKLVTEPEGLEMSSFLGAIVEANVLCNAVCSHLNLNGVNIYQWFKDNTELDDWTSVFETYDVFETFIPQKNWNKEKIKLVRKMISTITTDYSKYAKNRP